MTYHDDGSTSYVYHGGNVAYRHFVLNTDGGGFRWVYCIESGIRFGDSDDGYYSEQTDNSQYFNQLPEASRRGIVFQPVAGGFPARDHAGFPVWLAAWGFPPYGRYQR